jgi:hypothetical protein
MQGDERMSEEPQVHDALDQRIDAALRSYVKAPEFSDPRVVLARVRMLAEQQRERRRVWMWAVPAGVAALIALAAMVWVAQKPAAPQIAFVPKAPGVASVASPRLSAGEGKNAGSSTTLRHRHPRRSSAQDDKLLAAVPQQKLPKLDVFPAPQPLSDEERALVAFTTEAPPDLKKQVVEAQTHLGDPIQIAVIEIRPLNEDEQKAEPKGKDMR